MSDYQVRFIVYGALLAICLIVAGALGVTSMQKDAMIACVSAGGSFTDRGICVGKNHEMSRTRSGRGINERLAAPRLECTG